MKHLVRLFQGLDVTRLRAEVEAIPDAWNANDARTSDPASPHHGIPDIWLRYRDPSECRDGTGADGPHVPVWYPVVARLPSLRPFVHGLMARLLSDGVPVTTLGGVLLTHIRPGRAVTPHHDRGRWHAEHHNLKVYCPLRGDGFCLNRSGGETCSMLPGEAWFMDNQVDHSVVNLGDSDRWTLITCLRMEP